MRQAKIEVKGMQCNNCAFSINKTISAIRGIISVDVDLSQGLVKVEYAEDLVDVNQILSKIKRLGYEVVE